MVKQNRYNIAYNSRGQVTGDWTSQVKGNDTYLNKVTNTYDTTTGNLTSTVSDNYKNGVDGDAKDTSLSNSYDWYDVGKTLTANYDRDTNDAFNSIYTSTYTYDGLGRLQRVKIVDGIPRTVHFAVTAEEMILLRDINNSGPNDPEDHHLYVNGMHIAEYTSDNYKNIQNQEYATVISMNSALSAGSSKYYNGGSASGGGEFGTSGYDPINPVTAGTSSNGSRYTVSSGDTLETIAVKLWGDGSLWYKLAEANGLSANAPLAAGQSLSVPNGVIQNRNNADMFRPYEASRAAGDLSPTTRKPPKKNKCGMFGQLMLVAISIAVAVVLPEIAPAVFGGFWGGVGAAAVGSIVSQGVGLATGIQDKFSFKQVALSALSAGIAQGVGEVVGKGAMLGSKVVGGVVRGAVSSAVTQGVAVATGLQKTFDWAGVAAAGVSAGVGQGLGKEFASLGKYGQRLATNMAGGIANAATRSLINGSNFGDNMMAGLPDVLGQTIGGMIADGVSGRRSAGASGNSGGGAQATSSDTAAAQQPAREGAQSAAVQPDDGNAIVVTGTRLRNDRLFISLPFSFSRPERDEGWLGGASALAARFPGGASALPAGFGPDDATSEFKKKYSLEGMFDALGDGLAAKRDELAKSWGDLTDEALNRSVRGLAYVAATGAANSPFTSDLAAHLLTEWRDGTSPYNTRDKAEFFGWNSDASRELFLGYSGDYYRGITQLGIDQMAAAGNGVIRDGQAPRAIRSMPDFTGGDGLFGGRDGAQVGDVIGTFTYGVSVRSQGGYLYFTGKNAMSLGSFAAENRLQYNRIVNPSSGHFATTYQTFEWRVPVPQNLLPKGR